jgi:predicted AlkP superfamily phosphohydrolase/phosphomutase
MLVECAHRNTSPRTQEQPTVTAFEPHAPDQFETADTYKTKTREVETGGKTAAHPMHGHDVAREVEVEREREVGAPLEADDQPSLGGGGRTRRLLLVGLSGAERDLLLGAWRGGLHTLDLLAERGLWCRVRGTWPPDGAPAWATLLSGLDPGQLGIYGTRQRVNHSYAPAAPIDSQAIHEPRLWDMLGAVGKHIGVVAAPATTPAPAVHGHLVADKLFEGASPATFPASLSQQVSAWLGEAALPLSSPRREGLAEASSNFDQLIQQAYIRAEQRFTLARRLLARDLYDCFVLVDDGIATIQRVLWDSFDTAHPRYSADNPFAGTVGSFHRFVDDQLFELLELVDDDTVVAIVAPGGMQALHGELSLNEWLIAQGDLVLRHQPPGLVALEQCEVDWERTRAWAGEAGAIYLNVAGREPLGSIPASELESARVELAERLRALVDADGHSALEVQRPEALYVTAQGVAPDLIAVSTRPGWRTAATLGAGVWAETRAVRRYNASAWLDAACATPDGFLLVYDPHNLGGGRQLDDATIYDIAPTLLALFGQPIPARMRGRVIPGLW